MCVLPRANQTVVLQLVSQWRRSSGVSEPMIAAVCMFWLMGWLYAAVEHMQNMWVWLCVLVCLVSVCACKIQYISCVCVCVCLDDWCQTCSGRPAWFWLFFFPFFCSYLIFPHFLLSLSLSVSRSLPLPGAIAMATTMQCRARKFLDH